MIQTERTEGRETVRAGPVFYYDGGCGFCASVVRLLSPADFLGRVSWMPYQRLEAPPEGLAWEDMQRAAYLDMGQGRLYEGFYAFRRLSLLLVPLWPLAPFLWLWGVPKLGTAAYRWLAGNRYGISRCGAHLPGKTRRDAGR